VKSSCNTLQSAEIAVVKPKEAVTMASRSNLRTISCRLSAPFVGSWDLLRRSREARGESGGASCLILIPILGNAGVRGLRIVR